MSGGLTPWDSGVPSSRGRRRGCRRSSACRRGRRPYNPFRSRRGGQRGAQRLRRLEGSFTVRAPHARRLAPEFLTLSLGAPVADQLVADLVGRRSPLARDAGLGRGFRRRRP